MERATEPSVGLSAEPPTIVQPAVAQQVRGPAEQTASVAGLGAAARPAATGVAAGAAPKTETVSAVKDRDGHAEFWAGADDPGDKERSWWSKIPLNLLLQLSAVVVVMVVVLMQLR